MILTNTFSVKQNRNGKIQEVTWIASPPGFHEVCHLRPFTFNLGMWELCGNTFKTVKYYINGRYLSWTSQSLCLECLGILGMISKGPEKVELIKAVVLYWGQFWQCLEIFLTITSEGMLQIARGEKSEHAGKCYTMYRTAVHNSCLAANVSSAKEKKPPVKGSSPGNKRLTSWDRRSPASYLAHSLPTPASIAPEFLFSSSSYVVF